MAAKITESDLFRQVNEMYTLVGSLQANIETLQYGPVDDFDGLEERAAELVDEAQKLVVLLRGFKSP